ncbi:hypothetical protein CHLNCDRAFT_139195 [Chlorella variabilis]|uniref:Uncharacterized protein n=1 Tax=Chlorella variabilis TaxID=554065 RepID=E1ZPF9_CHLVA|nr:hypothetical protein CHLNCDRAFT_139195 [Chlorella variabilis]EFN52269.1 hypothetical protein CHLNCDRAFT_139195 [Chlorella variabilis]|eukprot:XP_005844371.1 hypothetical protein CHLNCDRAFT_139195 [Chlorella variabilis]
MRFRWYVDLGFQTDVHKVRIHNRCDVTNTGEQLWKRLQNFTIHVSHTEPFITGKLDPALNDTTLCYSHQGYQDKCNFVAGDDGSDIYTCTVPKFGRYVSIQALAVAAAVGLFLGLFSAAALLVLLRWVEKRLVEARPGGDSRPPRHAEPSVRHVPLEGSLQPARDPAPPTGEQTAEIAVIGLPGLAAEAAAGCLPTHEHACRRLCGWLHAFYSMSVSGVRVQRVWITRNGRMALEASLPAAMAATVLAGSKRLKGTGITLGPVLSPSELREREARRQQQPQPTPINGTGILTLCEVSVWGARWYVDLGQLAAVSSVRIVNRCDNPNGKQASLHSITSVLGLYDGI